MSFKQRFVVAACLFSTLGGLLVFEPAIAQEGVSTPTQSSSVAIQCRLLWLNAGFFESFDYSVPQTQDAAWVLTDIETFFLAASKHRPEPMLIVLPPDAETSIHDNVAKNGRSFAVKIRHQRSDESMKHKLVLSSAPTSKFRLKSPTSIHIPHGGSAVIRSAGSTFNGKVPYLWIITGQSAAH